jgi:heat shock protein HtpX
MKRIVLFVLTNLAVVALLLVTTSLLGVDRFFTAQGVSLGSLLAFSALIGFGGSFLSLAMSKGMAKMSTGAQVIVEPRDRTEAWLLRIAALRAVTVPTQPNVFSRGIEQ